VKIRIDQVEFNGWWILVYLWDHESGSGLS
jgi:hypothetical protein